MELGHVKQQLDVSLFCSKSTALPFCWRGRSQLNFEARASFVNVNTRNHKGAARGITPLPSETFRE